MSEVMDTESYKNDMEYVRLSELARASGDRRDLENFVIDTNYHGSQNSAPGLPNDYELKYMMRRIISFITEKEKSGLISH